MFRNWHTFSLSTVRGCLQLTNAGVQYNQFEICSSKTELVYNCFESFAISFKCNICHQKDNNQTNTGKRKAVVEYVNLSLG